MELRLTYRHPPPNHGFSNGWIVGVIYAKPGRVEDHWRMYYPPRNGQPARIGTATHVDVFTSRKEYFFCELGDSPQGIALSIAFDFAESTVHKPQHTP